MSVELKSLKSPKGLNDKNLRVRLLIKVVFLALYLLQAQQIDQEIAFQLEEKERRRKRLVWLLSDFFNTYIATNYFV